MRWQLPIVWVMGSVVTGTVGILFTNGRGDLPVVPLTMLGAGQMLALVMLVGAFGLALVALGWRTADATWLPKNDLRSIIVWTVAVGGVGAVGWGFAAIVTFALGFSLTTQLVLCYTCGGLPFALVAGMFVRPVLVNAVSTMITSIAVLVGCVLIDSPLQTVVLYLRFLVGEPFTTM
jgi:hypothetical protein